MNVGPMVLPLVYTRALPHARSGRSNQQSAAPAMRGRPSLLPRMVYGVANQRHASDGPRSRGLGASTSQQAGAAAASTLAAIAPATGPAAPFLLAAAALIGPIINMFQGCGQTCIQATTIANQAESALQSMMAQYMAQPVHYQSAQTAYLAYFDQVWAAMQQACGNPALGTAGQNCISQRQQGACYFKASPDSWSQDSTGQWVYTGFGASGSGTACVNMFTALRDPVANDPSVVADASPVAAISNAAGGVLSSLGISSSFNLSELLIPAGLVVVALLL